MHLGQLGPRLRMLGWMGFLGWRPRRFKRILPASAATENCGNDSQQHPSFVCGWKVGSWTLCFHISLPFVPCTKPTLHSGLPLSSVCPHNMSAMLSHPPPKFNNLARCWQAFAGGRGQVQLPTTNSTVVTLSADGRAAVL